MILVVFLWACKSSSPPEVEDVILRSYPGGEPLEMARYSGTGDDRRMILKWGFERDGSLEFRETYTDGVLETRTEWWPDSTLRAVRRYENDEVISTIHYDMDGVRLLGQTEIDSLLAALRDIPVEPATSDEIVWLETTRGMIRLRLLINVAPSHSNNFKRLANAGFYDSTTFHLITPGVFIQGGDILSRDATRSNDGSGTPGYTVPAEFNPTLHAAGTLAMYHSSDGPNTAGSQFYITLTRVPSLDNQYTVFGQVVDGMDVIRAISQVETDSRDNPVYPERILSIRVKPPESPLTDGEVLTIWPNGTPREVVQYEAVSQEDVGDERRIEHRALYYADGTQSLDQVYQNGELVSQTEWAPDGIRMITRDEVEAIMTALRDYPGEPATREEVVTMETSVGTIKLELYPDLAPIHSNNFKRLAKQPDS
ncbi:peptidylprolyl isomerase, partial [Candidatus Neomarinimicrobiota bacterium]